MSMDRSRTRMTKEGFLRLLADMEDNEIELARHGQQEYAGGEEESPFYNFEQVGNMVQCPHCGNPIGRLAVLMVYMLKHVFGVLAWVGGVKKQRDTVGGRIDDIRLYGALAAGMAEEDRIREEEECLRQPTAQVEDLPNDQPPPCSARVSDGVHTAYCVLPVGHPGGHMAYVRPR